MAPRVPDWLDRTFLTNILKGEERQDVPIEVVRFSSEPAMAPGNNYLSYIYRVRVEYRTGPLPWATDKNKTVSLMVKIPFAEGFMKEMCERHNFFDKEPKVYNQLLPILYDVTLCEFGPKSLNCPLENVLVMKDLKEEGYFLKEKTKQLEYLHCEAVFKKLAKFHAASVVCLNNNHKELVRDVGNDHFFVDGGPVNKMAKQAFKNVLRAVTEDERYARFKDFLLDRYDQIWPSCTKLTKPKLNGGFNVLNHGDLWVNNMFFKYNNSGEVVDVKFIDYQLTRIASPVNDLVYFMWTSANEEVRDKRQKELFSVYLNTLNKTLAALGCAERLSEQELREDLIRSVDFAFLVISISVPIIMATPEDAPDFSNMTDEEDFDSENFYKTFKSSIFKKLLPKYIHQFVEFFIDGKGMPDKNN